MPPIFTYIGAGIVYTVFAGWWISIEPPELRPDAYWTILVLMLSATFGGGLTWAMLHDADWFD
jgi:hypothetical protein